jgi:hypothetical protein
LEVSGTGDTTGDVVGGSSVGTSWNFGSEDGSTAGTVSSVLTDGELVLSIDGALSKSGTPTVPSLSLSVQFSFGFVAPDLGESTTAVLLQLTRASSALTGSTDPLWAFAAPDFRYDCSSQTLGGLLALGYLVQDLSNGSDSAATSSTFLPNDSVVCDGYRFDYGLQVEVDNSTGTFSETYTFRAIVPTPVPEPSSSLAIPSGAAMVLALSKLRGVSLIH